MNSTPFRSSPTLVSRPAWHPFALLCSLPVVLSVIVLLAAIPSKAAGQTAAPGGLSYDWRAALRGAINADEHVHAQEQSLLYARKARNASVSLAAIPRVNISSEGGGSFAKIDNPDASSDSVKPYVDVSLEIRQKLGDTHRVCRFFLLSFAHGGDQLRVFETEGSLRAVLRAQRDEIVPRLGDHLAVAMGKSSSFAFCHTRLCACRADQTFQTEGIGEAPVYAQSRVC